MEDDDLQSSLSVQSFDEPYANRSESSMLENTYTSEESNNELSEKLIYKKTKLGHRVIETKKESEDIKIEIIYGVCFVLDDLGKNCNTQLRIIGGSTSNLISHLTNTHGITQDRPKLYSDFKIHEVLLSFTYVRYPHTANVIQEKLEEVIEKWGLKGKVYSIITNNRSNMKAAINKMSDIVRILCSAHTLQLAVGKDLMPVEAFMAHAK
ncbi:12180_t:CDS:2 [Cetraspora pellucida]|uniref:12180_t:CDS:1 n=1 Tax=Cetraspora pellucida TaxID=1433469 RepID=A0A9N9HWX5_9GLOM|nr:12180_t:CDS:2 [Cetraspora pellucida]